MSDLWFLVTAAAWGCKHTPATLLSLPWPYQPNRLSAYYTAPLSFEGFSWSICVCLTSDGQKQIISSSFHIIFDKEGVRWMRRLIDLIIGRTPTQDYENGNLICVLGWHLLSVHGRDLIPSLHWRGDMIWYLINNLMTRPISSSSGAFNWITISTSSCPVYMFRSGQGYTWTFFFNFIYGVLHDMQGSMFFFVFFVAQLRTAKRFHIELTLIN